MLKVVDIRPQFYRSVLSNMILFLATPETVGELVNETTPIVYDIETEPFYDFCFSLTREMNSYAFLKIANKIINWWVKFGKIHPKVKN